MNAERGLSVYSLWQCDANHSNNKIDHYVHKTHNPKWIAAGTFNGLQYLWPEQTGANWASLEEPLGQVLYDTYTEDDYRIIWETYAYTDFSADFGKPNCSVAKPRHARLTPTVTKVYKQQVGAPSFVWQLRLPVFIA